MRSRISGGRRTTSWFSPEIPFTDRCLILVSRIPFIEHPHTYLSERHQRSPLIYHIIKSRRGAPRAARPRTRPLTRTGRIRAVWPVRVGIGVCTAGRAGWSWARGRGTDCRGSNDGVDAVPGTAVPAVGVSSRGNVEGKSCECGWAERRMEREWEYAYTRQQ
jgi:hypothetical protein